MKNQQYPNFSIYRKQLEGDMQGLGKYMDQILTPFFSPPHSIHEEPPKGYLQELQRHAARAILFKPILWASGRRPEHEQTPELLGGLQPRYFEAA